MGSFATLLDSGREHWKLALCFYFFVVCACGLDVMNISVFWSPIYFSFMPIFLFVGAIKMPDFIPVGGAFLIGLLTDLLSYSPMGLMAAIYCMTVIIGQWQSRFVLAQPFRVVWSFFTLYWVCVLALSWGIESAYSRNLFDLLPVVHMLIYGAIAFPFVWAAFQYGERFFFDGIVGELES